MDELITARSHLKSGKVDPKAATPVFLSTVSRMQMSDWTCAEFTVTGPGGEVSQAIGGSGL